MSRLLIACLSVFFAAAHLLAAATAAAPRTKNASSTIPDPDDPVEKEYQKLLEQDDAALQEVDKWIRDNAAFREQGAGIGDVTLRGRIEQRLRPAREAYEDFLKRHPDHARAHLAYGSFLNDIHDEEGAVAHWEKARELDPKNPAAWNNLANYYGHRSPVEKSFEYYAKAIELNPREPVYFQNLATTVFLFRPAAMAFYHITEQEVFDKALELYRQAMKLDPTNFVLASDYAISYYGIKPDRTEEAIKAWEHALKVASDEKEREGVYVHLARLNLSAGRFDETRRLLDGVTNEIYATLKQRLARNLDRQEKQARETNAPPATIEKRPATSREPGPVK